MSQNQVVTPEHTQTHLEARVGSFVRLSVTDTGTGIAPETLPRIFDPFFTTKPVGKGKGMGLAMVHGIIKQHQGWVECHSTPGKGTTFGILLPRSREETLAPNSTPGTTAQPVGRKTIFLVCNNETVRNLTTTFLRLNGFQVVQAEDTTTAIHLLQTKHFPIDLILFDLNVPPQERSEILHRFRQIAPRVPALLSTPDPAALPEARTQGFVGALVRPFHERDLVQAVQEALEAPRAS